MPNNRAPFIQFESSRISRIPGRQYGGAIIIFNLIFVTSITLSFPILLIPLIEIVSSFSYFFFLSFRFSFSNKPPLDWQPIAITPQLFAFSIFSSHNLTISERETTVSSTYNHRYVLPKLQFSVWIFNWRKETWWVARRGEGNASENCSKWEQFVAGLTLRDLQCSLTDGSNGFFTFVIIIYIYI